MAGQLVAGQFLTTQNWALGAALAIVLVGAVLLATAVGAITVLLLRTAPRIRRRVVIPLTAVPA